MALLGGIRPRYHNDYHTHPHPSLLWCIYFCSVRCPSSPVLFFAFLFSYLCVGFIYAYTAHRNMCALMRFARESVIDVLIIFIWNFNVVILLCQFLSYGISFLNMFRHVSIPKLSKIQKFWHWFMPKSVYKIKTI